MQDKAFVKLDFESSKRSIALIVLYTALQIVAWLLYLYLPTFCTPFILPVHYAGLYGAGILSREYKKITQVLILVSLLSINIALDVFLYDELHGLMLDFFYYASVNCLHVTLVIVDRKNKTFTIQIILLGISIILWFLNIWQCLIPLFIVNLACWVLGKRRCQSSRSKRE